MYVLFKAFAVWIISFFATRYLINFAINLQKQKKFQNKKIWEKCRFPGLLFLD